MWSFLGTLIGAFVSIGTVVFVEYLRRPSLKLSKEDPPPDARYHPPGSRPATDMRTLRVKLFNKPLTWWAKWMVRAVGRWTDVGPAAQSLCLLSYLRLLLR